MTTAKEQLQTKIERVHAARMDIDEFVTAGGDVKSKEGALLGLELARSCKDLCEEFDQKFMDEAALISS